MITQTQSSGQGPAAANGTDAGGAMDSAVSNSSSNGFSGGGSSDDMQNKPLPSFQK